MFGREFHVSLCVEEGTLPRQRLQWFLSFRPELVGADVWAFVDEWMHLGGVLGDGGVVCDGAATVLVPGSHGSFSLVELVLGPLELFDAREDRLGLPHGLLRVS